MVSRWLAVASVTNACVSGFRCVGDSETVDLLDVAALPKQRTRKIIVYEGGSEQGGLRVTDSKLYREVTLAPGEQVFEVMIR